ncbi:MAG TPA: hypothetical protein VNZ54_02525 [bacterium]|nr:hypothetical protein [bacterium]HXB96898.1 hypothetical protein [bacterium]HXC64586.1 hypothetical protein [bacterium]
MKSMLINFVIGVVACMAFSLIHVRVAHGMGYAGDFADQGPTIFAGGVLVALLLKNNKY